MFSIGGRFTTLLIAAAILFVAYRMQKSSKRGLKMVSIAGAFVAGLGFLVTFIGEWITGGDAKWMAGIGVAGLIVCLGTLAIDWLADKKPDMKAFCAAFALAFFLVLGVTNLPEAGSQIGDGAEVVGNQFEQASR